MAEHRSISRYAGAGVCAILLSACATGGGAKGDIVGYGKHADYKDAVGAFTSPAADPTGMDPIAAAAYWGTAYDRTPTAQTAVKYSAALRKIGSTKEAAAVMQKASTRFPGDADVSLEYGKTLIEQERAFEAVRHLEIAAEKKRGDWQALSAYGVALDQIDEHELARARYDEALRLSPGNVNVLNNKGLSYALDGDLKTAVKTLRAATANRQGDARVRQNLALVLAINGDMREAERLARSDLPPQLADQNVAYFRQLMTQPAFWQDYASTADAPNFDAPKTTEPTALTKPKAPKAAKPAPLKEEPKAEDAPTKPVAQGKTVTAPTSASAVIVEPKKQVAKPATKEAAKPAAATPVTPASATKPAPIKPAQAPVKSDSASADQKPAAEAADPAPNIKK